MVRRPIKVKTDDYPDVFLPYFDGADTYDSSCSPFAKVIFIDKGEGFYLKTSEKGLLENEADMTSYFASKGLSARVVEYISADKDYMLTERVAGEDCTYYKYLEEPERLCDTIAELLRRLHEIEGRGCPVSDHTERYFETVDKNYKNRVFDPSYIYGEDKYKTPDEIYRYICENKSILESNTLLHGDYCLPNIMLLDGFRFSGFIDVGNGGIGDRHVDLFWGAWTLEFNLHTDKYRDRFFSAYGKEKIDQEKLKLIGFAEAFG